MKNNRIFNEKRRKRRRKENTLIGGTCVVAIVFLLSIVLVWNWHHKPQIATEKLDGLWVFDSTTSYEFMEDGKGILHVQETEYHFTYKIKRKDIFIDFKDDIVEDCVYGLSFDNEMLYLEGKAGTSGGVYELERGISK